MRHRSALADAGAAGSLAVVRRLLGPPTLALLVVLLLVLLLLLAKARGGERGHRQRL